MTRGPLVGTRVLDATRALAGPICTMMLADIGADVVKIEMPVRGDETRYWGPPFLDHAGPTFIGFNRNKRDVALDLRTEGGQNAFLALARVSDVVVENFRPGTMKRFGLDYERLREIRPDLIYCAITGYGQKGPLAKRPAMDLMIQAVGGLMSQTGEPHGRPMKVAAPVGDVMGGVLAAFSIVAAIRERDRTGEGRFIDVSMLDSLITLMGQNVTAYGMSGKPPRREGNAHALMAPYESFRSATEEFVVSVTTDKRWAMLCSLPEFAHMASDPRYPSQAERNAHRAELVPELEAIFLTKPREYWLECLERAGLPVEPVNTLPDILNHPHVIERGTLIPVEYPLGSGSYVKVPGMPWRDVAADRPVFGPPSVGQHTLEVLTEIGLDEEQIERASALGSKTVPAEEG